MPSAASQDASFPLAAGAPERRRAHAEAAVHAFTRIGAPPRLTFPLVLASVTVATVAMHVDMVTRYSQGAFVFGVIASAVLAVVVGRVLSSRSVSRGRAVGAAIVLPALGAGLIGVTIQAIVLGAVQGGPEPALVRDLGGLVDTANPVGWVLAGTLLGAAPALAVSAFLLLAGRTLRRLVGHDAAEGFGVAFTGGTGLVASVALFLVEPWEMAPLVGVVLIAGVAVLLAFLVDGARMAFLRRVFAGEGSAIARDAMTYQVVPVEHFRLDASLAPVVADAGAVHVLVRSAASGSYRAAAGEPIALLAATEAATVRPLRRRRIAAGSLVVTMTCLGATALGSQADFSPSTGACVLDAPIRSPR